MKKFAIAAVMGAMSAAITNQANATMSMVGTTAGTAGLDPRATTVGINHVF